MKGKKSRARGSGVGKDENRIVKFVGRYMFRTSGAVTVNFLQLSPIVMDARILAVSDAWQEFRFTRVKARSWLGNITAGGNPVIPPGGADLSLGYTPALPTIAPITGQEVMQMQNAATGNGTYGCPYPSIRMNRRDLLGAAPVKWYRRGTAYDDTLEVQGVIYILSTDPFNYRPNTTLVEYECEFRTPSDLALTASVPRPLADVPDPQAMARQILELQRVLGLDGRIARRPLLQIETSAGETKESDEYVRVNEPVEVPSVSAFPPPPSVRSVVGARPNWGSIPNTPASARPR